MKTRQVEPDRPSDQIWSEGDWGVFWIEAHARHNKSKRSPGHNPSVTVRSQLIGLVAEYHVSDHFDLPRPDPVSSVANGRHDITHPTLGRLDVKGHNITTDGVWISRHTLHRTDMYCAVGVDVEQRYSIFHGMFNPLECVAKGVPEGAYIRLRLGEISEEGTLKWNVQQPLAAQSVLPGLVPPDEFHCRCCDEWYPSASFHRNRTKRHGVQDECKRCKSAMERERKLRIRGRVT